MECERLEQELVRADREVFETLRRLVSIPHGTSKRAARERQYNETQHHAADLRRQLAELTGDEHAIWLDLGVKLEAAISGDLLIQTENHCFLIFNVSAPLVDHQVPQAIVQFTSLLKTRYGLPTPKAHALSEAGLKSYGAYEVVNSRWVAEERRLGQLDFPHHPFQGRHFIFAFRDTSFECLAYEMSLRVDTRPFREIWTELYEKISEA